MTNETNLKLAPRHPYRAPDAPTTIAPKDAAAALRALRAELAVAFRERQNVIDSALAAVLAGEHVLLLGPPGTAKSSLARAIARAFGGLYFEWLLTKFSTPDEVFGPVSLRALEEDRFERVTRGKLPEADFAFIDEIFKASSAILNTLLAVANERVFHNGVAPVPIPLATLFGASNELPEGRELEALFDRFLVRCDVQYVVQPASVRELLLASDPDIQARMNMSDLAAVKESAMAVAVTEETLEALLAIRDDCQAEGIVASDRRWKKALRLVRASAFMAGEERTSPEDLAVLGDSLWREPRERSKVVRIVGKHADPVGAEAREVLEAAREAARGLIELKKGEQAAYVGGVTKAMGQYVEMKNRLTEIAGRAGKRSRVIVDDARAEVQGLHAEAARAVSASLGLGGSVRAS